MLKFYRALRMGFIVLLLALVVFVLILENIRGPMQPKAGEPSASPISFYETLRGAVLYDPYDNDVLSRVNASSADFKKDFYLIANSVSDLITNSDFYNNVFIFMVSKKAEGIAGLINQVFTNITSFNDLVILDRDHNVIYKHGSASFSIDDFNTTNDRAILTLDKEIAILGKYRDATLDSEIRIIALFSVESIANRLKEFPFPAFLIISNRMYRNAGILPDIVRNVQQNLSDEREYYTGLSVVRTFNLSAINTHVGTLGIAYPARSISSVILIFLKIAVLVLLILGLFAIDRSFRNRIRKMELQRKEQKIAVPKMKPRKKEATPEEEEAAIDMRLDWFQDYVQDQDRPEEKDDKGEKK